MSEDDWLDDFDLFASGPQKRASSFAQQRLWVLDRLDPTSTAYHCVVVLRVRGPIDLDALEATLQRIAQRHDVLRTHFEEDADGVWQVIESEAGLPVQRFHSTHGESEEAARAFALSSFDLTTGPLARVGVFELAHDEHLLVFSAHHIIWDGTSTAVFVRELSAGYREQTQGGQPLPELETQYCDYAAWQRQVLEDEGELERQLAYWKGALAGVEPLALPSDHRRPPVALDAAGIVSFHVPPDVTQAVQKLARDRGTTQYVAWLSLVGAFMGRLARQSDITIGSPIANRRDPRLRRLLGFFANTVVQRISLDPKVSLNALMERTHRIALRTQENQDAPFERVVQVCDVPRDLSSTPLFQVLFGFHEAESERLSLGAVELERVDSPPSAQFDLAWNVSANGNASLVYRSSLYEPSSATRWVEQFLHFASAASGSPDLPLSDTPLAPKVDEERVLRTFNETSAPRVTWDVLSRLQEVTRAFPDRPAIRFGGEQASYAEFDERTSSLAAELRRRGVEEGSTVAVFLERSAAAVEAPWAIWKAGGVYAPITAETPDARVAYQLEDCRPTLVMTSAALEDRLPPSFARFDVENFSEAQADSTLATSRRGQDVAYIIYTSGSTGRPKGVVCHHAGLANRLAWMKDVVEIGEASRVAHRTPVGFDVSLWELTWPLLMGATVSVAPPDAHKDPRALQRWLTQEKVEVVHFVPSMLEAWLGDAAQAASLRAIVCSGEALPTRLAHTLLERLPGVALHNLYGPTETGIEVTRERCLPGRRVRLGGPVVNTRTYVLDPNLRPCAVGVPGELHLAGIQLAYGYLGRAALTATQFVPDPYSSSGERLYRTGDLVRWTDDGALEYLGRIDSQVKLRGIRIELGEIESVLQEDVAVARAVVDVRSDLLHAYIVAAPGATPDLDALRALAVARMPAVMVPSTFTPLDEVPLSSSGKLDRRRLPDPERRSIGYVAPRTENEAALATIWQDLLGVERVGRDDEFFALGGHSLLATRLVARVASELDRELPLRAVFGSPTLRAMADALGGLTRVPSLEAVSRERRLPASYAQQRMWVLYRLDPTSSAYHMPTLLEVSGSLDVDALERALHALTARHEVLRTRLVEDADGLVQEVRDDVPLRLQRFALDGEDARAHARAWVREPFDLAAGEVLRAAVYASGPDEALLAFCMHHVASDGVSMEVLVREFGALYAAECAGETATLPSLPVQYADYAVWQREWMEGEGELERQLDYWTQQLAGVEPLALPIDYPRPPELSAEAVSVPLVFSPSLSARVADFAQAQGTTPYVVWLSLFGAVLSHLGRQQDVTIGSPVANRRAAQLEGLIGFFVNTVVQRIDLSGRPSLTDLVARTHEMALRTQEHQDAPFEKVVDACEVPRDTSSTPLFQAIFTHGRTDDAQALALGDVTFRAVPTPPAAKFDLALDIRDAGAGASGVLAGRASLFRRSSLERIATWFASLAEEALASPDRPLQQCHGSDAEGQATALRYADPDPRPEPTTTVVERLAQVVASEPARDAVRWSGGAWSYEGLWERAGWIAASLQAAGVRADDRVLVLTDRSANRIAALVGVLRAGAAYVAVDAGVPDGRLEVIAQSADLAAVLHDDESSVRARRCADGKPQVAIESATGGAPSPLSVPPSSLAYVSFTSGSTGTPKGVAVTHANVVRLVDEPNFMSLNGCVFLHLSVPDFDAATLELWGALCNGGAVAIPEAGMLDLETIETSAVELGATACWLTAGLFHSVIEERPSLLSRFEVILAGGDRLDPERVGEARAAMRPGSLLINGYGPTENTTFTSCHEIQPSDATRPRVPIGIPISGTQAFVLGPDLSLCPVGMVGELWAAGLGVARGYHGRPDLTAERFVPNPFGPPGSRMYRTGDLARWNEDGTLDFLGRADSQIKLRGYRIELGEIEAALTAQAEVRQAVVALRDERLCAYVVAEPDVDLETVRAQLADRLPDYMVPTSFTGLDELPLSASGKVDRRALPEPELAQAEYHAPRGDDEEALAAIWQDLLGVERVSREDDFFALGGHSLLATRLVARVGSELGRELPLRSVFGSPRLRAMCDAMSGAARVPILKPVSQGRRLPASYAQQRMWVLYRLDPTSSAYHMPTLLEVSGSLDVDALERALHALTARHDVLRTRLVEDADGLVQEVRDDVPLRLQRFALDGEAARAHARAWVREPFDLAAGEVLRAAVYASGPDEALLAFCMHHIASDGVSMEVLVREIGALYAAECAGETAALPALPVQYADYAVWQREWMEGEGELERQLDYWTRQLRGVEPLALPIDYTRPAEVSAEAVSAPIVFAPSLSARVTELARAQGTTPYVVWLSVFGAVLGRLGRQQDVTIGSPVANRRAAQLEGLIGFFVNTVVQRVDLSGRPSLRELVARTHEMALRTQEHQDAPFEKVVDACGAPRDTSSTPLFQAMFTHGRADDAQALALGDVTFRTVPTSPAAKFDLALDIRDDAEGTSGALAGRASLFRRSSLQRMATWFASLAEEALGSPDRPLDECHGADAESRATVLRYADPDPRPEPTTTVVERLAQVVAREPARDAVRWSGGAWSYEGLWERAGWIAASLQAAGVRADDRVLVLTDRSANRIAAMLGVLRAGAAYVAVDGAVPEGRLEVIARSADVAAVLHDDASSGRANAEGTPRGVSIEGAAEGAPSPLRIPPTALAYISFTSGSTGTPKGVAVTHANVMRLVDEPNFMSLEGCAFLHLSVPDFDAATLEIWGALCNGGTVAVPKPGLLDLEAIEASANELGASACWLTAGLFHSVVEERPSLLEHFEVVLAGGDRLDPERVGDALRAMRPEGRLINGYGPTENTTFTSCHAIQPSDATRPRVPIGIPVSGTQAYVLGPDLELCPIGMIGELWAAGTGVARGYHGRPDLTAERFVPNPFGPPGSRMYRTGDLARWNEDGTLDFLGRVDTQVKLRGYRIELGEIETALTAHGAVRQAVVALRGERLCAYVVAGPAVDLEAVRAQLADRLPEYMVPVSFTRLDELPLSASGKVDRRALPEPELDQAEYHAPRGGDEEALATIWQDLLGVERVGRDDDFFALGGHSLVATRLVARVASELDRELPLRAVFTAPTLRAMADALGGDARVPPLRPIPRERRLPASYAQERMWVLHKLDPGSSAYHIPTLLEVDGELDVDAVAAALDDLVARHEVLRTRLSEDTEGLAQVIEPESAFSLERHAMPRSSALAHARGWATRPFDLAGGEVLRAAAYQLAPGKHLLGLCMHHIASDGVSMEVLVRDFGALYEAKVTPEGGTSPLPALPVQYADYAAWQRQWMDDGELVRQLAFWRAQLRGVEPLALPTDFPRPSVASDEAGTVEVAVSGELSTAIEAFARDEGTTPYVVWLSIFGELLGRYAGQRDLTIGSPVANRRDPQLEGLIGFFVNTVVQRIDRSGRPTFRELVRRTHETAIRTQEHQDAPFEKVVEVSGAPRDLSNSPLFQAMLAFQAGGVRDTARLSGLSLRSLEADVSAKFDLNLALVHRAAGSQAMLTYRRTLFSEASIERLVARLVALANHALVQPDTRLEDVSFESPAEQRQQVEATTASEPGEAPDIVEAFEQRALDQPQATALRLGDHSLSYAELNERADKVASELQRRGVGAGSLVALTMERSFALFEAILGVWKVGAAYLPVEPTLPFERAEFMKSDADAVLDLSEADVEAMRAAPTTAWRSTRCHPSVPAYLLYTSGTTGRPKGVWVSRGALARYTANARERFPMGGQSLLHGSLSFDATLASFLPVWLEGGCVTLAALGPGLEPLQRALEAGEFDLVKGTPTHLAALEPALRRRAGAWLIGGEVLREELVDGLHVFNQYGPTECTVGCTSWDSASGSRVSLGRPYPGTRAYVLDESLRRCPSGVRGELYLAGEQLALGYHRRASLTSEKFVPDPFGPAGARMYRTGDRARWNEDGTLQFLGRVDNQLKLRGYRVELGEIEAALESLPTVRRAGAAVRGERVCAYVVPAHGMTLDWDSLRDSLARRLPEYMVPVSFTVLDALPLTPSGKLDRRALPEPALDQAEYAAPLGEIEKIVAALWVELLSVERVGREDDFFALGGHSLRAVSLCARLSTVLGTPVPAALLFANPRLSDFARAIDEDRSDVVLRLNAAETPTRAVVFVPGIGHGQVFDSLRRALSNEVAVFMLRPLGVVEGEDVPSSLDGLLKVYADSLDALLSSDVPLALIGHSLGGRLAMALGRALRARDRRVDRVVMLDSFVRSGDASGWELPEDLDPELARYEAKRLEFAKFASGALAGAGESDLGGVPLTLIAASGHREDDLNAWTSAQPKMTLIRDETATHNDPAPPSVVRVIRNMLGEEDG